MSSSHPEKRALRSNPSTDTMPSTPPSFRPRSTRIRNPLALPLRPSRMSGSSIGPGCCPAVAQRLPRLRPAAVVIPAGLRWFCSGKEDRLVEFRILGPLEVVRAGERLEFRGSRERAVLALLVLNANRTVSPERLAEDLWGDAPPEGAAGTLRAYVSRVRRGLGEAGALLVTRASGYLLQVEPGAIDAARFAALVAEGGWQAAEGDHRGAAATLRQALALWRGPALADVAEAPSARAEAARLEETRMAALEARLEADLACGRHGELVGELEAVTQTHPLRERFWQMRMLALYRAGRQAEALRTYQELRRILGEELGIEPSPTLQRLETAVLRQDSDLEWRPSPGAGVAVAVSAGPPPGDAAFVGRAAELARLDTAWEAARSGRRQLVLVAGEPGIGKSRLTAEFTRRCEAATVVF